MENASKSKVMTGWSLNALPREQTVGRAVFCIICLSVLAIGTLCLINAVKWIDKPFGGFLLNQRMAIGFLNQEHWAGTKAGLRYPDKILKANGRDISSIKGLEKVTTDTNDGGSITYTVDTGEKIREVNIPVTRFSISDFFMTFGINFSVGIVYFIIGFIVFILKPDVKASSVFCFATVLQSVTSFITFDLESTHFGFLRLQTFVDTFLPAAIIHLSLLFPEKSTLIKNRRYPEILPYIVSAVLFITIESLYPAPSFLPVYRFTILYTDLSVILFIVAILVTYAKKSSVIARQRARVIFLGAFLALPVPATALLVRSFGWSFGEMRFLTDFSDIPILIFPASIAYAIAKHNLFDVDVYIKRAVGYAIMTAIVGSVYFCCQLTLRTFILEPLFGESAEKIYPVLFALFVVFFFNPINKKVQGFVDRLFYRKKADYRDTVLSISNALTSVLNIDEIIKRIMHTLRKEMFIEKAGVILLEPEKECKALFVGDNRENPGDITNTYCLPHDDPFITLLSREKKIVTEYDIDEDSRYMSVREQCRKRFSEIGATIAIPLTYRNEVTGILALGNKKSGHFYSREDILLLETLSNQGAVALENAKLAEQMKKEETVRTNLARYLSPQIVDDIVRNDVQVNLGGDRKVVTVLFSDIRNFTTITETRPPDQLIHILNEYFSEMAKIIFDNQGSLDKYIGDAIVAVFGSLVHVENPAQNAVTAAVQMMKRLPVLNKHWMEEFGFSMDIGIGINTGEVFLGNIGSPERMEFTVIGDTVNVASRFSGLAKAGQILMTKDAFINLDPEQTKYNELPPSEVKGKSGKLQVFEVVY